MGEAKTCSKCKIIKTVSDFGNDKHSKTSLTTACKACRLIQKENWAINNPEKYQAMLKIGRVKRYAKNKETIKAQTKLNYRKNIEHYTDYHKDYFLKNKEIITKRKKEYYKNNPDKAKRIKSAEQKSNTQKYVRNKYKTDILFKLKHLLRSRMRYAFKAANVPKKSKALDAIGVDIDIARKHIERQFKKGMSWDNYKIDVWHIDHIIPLSSGKTEEELISLCHYTNLQPLWYVDNLSKGNKIPQVQTKLTI